MTAKKSEQHSNFFTGFFNSRKGKVAAVAVIVSIVVITSVMVYTSVVKDKSPGGQWIEAERDNLDYIAGRWNSSLGEWGELLEAMDSRPHSINAELGGSLEEGNPGLADRHLQMVQQVMERGTMNIKTEVDPAAEKSYCSASVSVYGMNLISASLFHRDDQIGLKVPRLFDYYLFLDKSRFGDAARLFASFYPGPDELKLPELSGDSLLNYLEQNINDEYVEITPGLSYNSPEGKTEVKQITLSLPAEEADEFFQGLINALNEEAGFRSLAQNLAEMAELANGFSGVKEGTKNLFNGLTEALTGEKQLHFPRGFEMVLLLDKGGRIVKRDVSFAAEDAVTGESIAGVNFEGYGRDTDTDEAQAGGRLALSIDESDDNFILGYGWAVNPEEDGYNEDFEVYAGVAGSDIDLQKFFKTEVSRVFRPDLETGTSSYDTDVRITFPMLDDAGLALKISEEIDQDIENNYHVSNTDFDLKLHDTSFGLGDLHMLANVHLDVQFSESKDIPEPDMDGAVNLSELDKNEWRDILAEIRDNLSEYMDRFRFLMG